MLPFVIYTLSVPGNIHVGISHWLLLALFFIPRCTNRNYPFFANSLAYLCEARNFILIARGLFLCPISCQFTCGSSVHCQGMNVCVWGWAFVLFVCCCVCVVFVFLLLASSMTMQSADGTRQYQMSYYVVIPRSDHVLSFNTHHEKFCLFLCGRF